MTKGLIRWILFLLIPLCCLELFFPLYGRKFAQDWFYFGPLKHLKPNPIGHVFFVGSSRVAAAIDLDTFVAALKPEVGEPQVFNLGQGASTMPMHYLGLRKLIREHSPVMAGCHVFIEAPAGLPDPSSWESPWVYQEYPFLIAPLLHQRDLGRFMNLSKNSLETKSFVLAAHYSNTCFWLPGFRDRLMAFGEKQLDRWSQKRTALQSPADLTGAGGIRSDESAVKSARDSAVAQATRDIEEQAALGDWELSVLSEIVDLIHSVGGEVIFFEAPLCSVQQRPYQTALRQRERFHAGQQFEKWHTALLSPKVSFEDGKFPDLWHLGKTSAPVFTQALAVEYMLWRKNFLFSKTNP